MIEFVVKYPVSWPEVFNSWIFVSFPQSLALPPTDAQSFLPHLYTLQGCGRILDTFIYTDTGYHICIWMGKMSRLFMIFFLVFFWSELFEINLLWHCISTLQFNITFSYQSGFSSKNKKPLHLKQKGIWCGELGACEVSEKAGRVCSGWASGNRSWDTPWNWPTSSPTASVTVKWMPCQWNASRRKSILGNPEYFLNKLTFKWSSSFTKIPRFFWKITNFDLILRNH